MLSVVLITASDPESGTPSGLYAAALARALGASGHQVHIITRTGPTPRPRHDARAPITTHRLPIRRNAPDAAFVIEACRRTCELRRSGRCDVIECLDAPAAGFAIATLGHLLGDAPI
ncbi:MAG: glycosyltransferase, partial [Phycisphaerales bacterium]|nr:glycosyltransferase [Phycisphaerales bacterium]